MKQIIIYILAILLFMLFAPIGVVYAWFRSQLDNSFGDYMKDSAIGINQSGNVAMRYLFNDLMIKQNGKAFGDPNETISHVLGVNKIDSKLRAPGKLLAWVLNQIDVDHVEKAAKNPQ